MTVEPRDATPIDQILPDIVAKLRSNSNLVIKAPAGAGKTTRVPPAILDAGLAGDRTIIMLEPRRLAAQSSARRIASERKESLGETIGYQVRFERRASPRTKLLIATEGIFLRMLLDDPLLERASVVIFDEFHERSLNSDLALALVRRLQKELRPELKVVVMSATFDPQRIASFLECDVLVSEGRTFPVETSYLRFPRQRAVHEEAAHGALQMAAQTPGDVLVFLPGVGEIRRTRHELTNQRDVSAFDIVELYGDLPADRQEAALQTSERRRIVLSTNVAETSVTLPGVTGVVDTGLARILRHDPAVGLNRLTLSRISRASADQRAGRAGRTRPGSCLRLWSADEWKLFKEYEVPEVARLELASAVLQLHAWGESDVQSFPWFEAPPQHALDQAELLLHRLGALDGNQITQLGRAMTKLPVHPRLALLLIDGEREGCAELTTTAAALLSERDPFTGDRASNLVDSGAESDVLDRIRTVEIVHGKEPSSRFDLPDARSLGYLMRVREQLRRETRDLVPAKSNRNVPNEEAESRFLKLLVAAFPDRVARRRDEMSRQGVMVGGRGIRLSDRSRVRRGSLFLCVDIEEVDTTEAFVRQASKIEEDWLPSDLVSTQVEVEFDESRERVIAYRRRRYEDLLLEESATAPPDSDVVAEVLAKAAVDRFERVAPVEDSEAAQFLIRVRCLREWMPQLDLPDVGESQLKALLPEIARGKRSFSELREAPWMRFLEGLFTAVQLAAIHREAPERMAAASGSRIRLEYSIGRPPVMPVRIQEMFGQQRTPTVAGGRMPVLLHLLAPNMRPQQVTDDLAGFWERTYPLVRKELRRRYPKHSWPDDPAHAPPEHRPKKPKK